MRLPSGLLQGWAASIQSMASRVNLVPGALDLTYRAAIKTIILVLVSFILLYVVVKYVRADDIMLIQPISVPPLSSRRQAIPARSSPTSWSRKSGPSSDPGTNS